MSLDYYRACDEERSVFGDYWCGPDVLKPWERTLVARFEAQSTDGQPVEVDCTAAPARFYAIRVLESRDEDGKVKPAIEFRTGTGAHKLAADLAHSIATGMLVFRHPGSLAPAAVKCDCECHTEEGRKSGMMHCFPCCEGQCPHCGVSFAEGLQSHVVHCAERQQATRELEWLAQDLAEQASLVLVALGEGHGPVVTEICDETVRLIRRIREATQNEDRNPSDAAS